MSWLAGYLGNQPSGASSRPRRENIPTVNYAEVDEEDLEEGLNFDSPLTSPQRPVVTRAGSPATLAYPTLQDNVDEELNLVRQTLQNIGHTPCFRPSTPEEVGESVEETGKISQEPLQDNLQNPPADQAEDEIIMVNYDQQNEDDDAGAIANSRDVKLPFNKDNIRLWFSLIESRMQFAGLKKQWSKRQILIQLIPPEFHSDFQHFLIMQEALKLLIKNIL